MLTKLISRVKDPGSALTHFIGAILSIFASVFLMWRSIKYYSYTHIVSVAIFSISLISLYTASTLYHTLDLTDKINKKLRKFDHIMIYCLIAGTYTPICLIILKGPVGYAMLIIIWLMAIAGLFVTLFMSNPRKWMSSTIYIIMGWTCIFAFKPLFDTLSLASFLWLLAGGILYTVGGVIYALKLPLFDKIHPNFGAHEIFHLFVMAGSTCHVIFMLVATLPIPT